MGWENHAGAITFYCDGPDCEVTGLYHIAETRNAGIYPHSLSDFAVCFNRARGLGWHSFKKTGRPWEYFCPKCVPAAEEAQRHHNEQEAERERIKQRNARAY